MTAVPEERPGGDERHQERRDHGETGEATGDGLRQPAPERGIHDEAQEGQERNQEQHVTT